MEARKGATLQLILGLIGTLGVAGYWYLASSEPAERFTCMFYPGQGCASYTIAIMAVFWVAVILLILGIVRGRFDIRTGRYLATHPSKVFWFLGSIAVTAAIVAGWQYIANEKLVSPVFLPGPDRAWAALVEGLRAGDLRPQMLETIERMLYGWVLASIIGIALGTLIGSSRFARTYLGPTLEFIRPLPASAVAPVAIAFFGLSNAMVLGVIGFGTLWPMLLATIHGFASVEPRLVEVSRVLRLSRLAVIWKIALPNAMPDILAGMRLGLTVSLILAVVGEMLTGQDGIGHRVLLAARSFQSPDLFAGVILLGLIGLVSNAVLSILDNWLLRWRATH